MQKLVYVMNRKKVCFITNEGSRYLFNDLINANGVKSIIFKNPSNKIMKYVKKIHTNALLNKFICVPYRDFWFDYNEINRKVAENDIVLINSSAMVMPSSDFWKKIQVDNSSVKFVLLLVDSMNVSGGHMVETRRRLKEIKWDNILSYDLEDCKKYGYTYIEFNYYSEYKIHKEDVKNDLYYIASVKNGRKEILQSIWDLAQKNNAKYLCKIYSIWRKVTYGMCIRKPLPYERVLQDIAASNCLLEILQTGQKSQSLRSLEAVIYNKKLLTNNVAVKNLPFYDSKYMKVFKDTTDIDWNWVKNREHVHYDYQVSFSSRNILQYL